MIYKVVTKSCEFGISREIAARAGLVRVPADLRTGRGLRLVVYEVVIQCWNEGINIAVTTFTSMRCVSLLRTSRRSYNISIVMYVIQNCYPTCNKCNGYGCLVGSGEVGRFPGLQFYRHSIVFVCCCFADFKGQDH